MPKEMDLVKYYTIKGYVKDVLDMRISKTSVDNLRIRFNQILKGILRESKQKAKDDKRDTIMPRDTDPVTQKYLGSKNLSWEDVFDEVKNLNAIELGNLAKAVTKYIKEQKEKAS
jgi:histone H3/H4